MAKYLINSLEETGNTLRREFKGYIYEGYSYDRYSQFNFWKIGDFVTNFFEIDYLNLLTKLKAEEYPSAILRYYQHAIHNKSVRQIYTYYSAKELANKYADTLTKLDGINLYLIHTANSFLIYPIYNLTNLTRDLNEEIRLLEGEIKYNSRRKGLYEIKYLKFVKCDGTNLPLSLEEQKNKKTKLSVLYKAYANIISKLSDIESQFFNSQEDKIKQFDELYSNYKASTENICKYIDFMLSDSIYSFIYNKAINSEYDNKTNILVVDYLLPNRDLIPIHTMNKYDKWVELAITKQNKLYDDIIYAIVIRSLAEICHYDEEKYIKHICLNGKIKGRSHITGQMEEKYILSINVSREEIESLNLEFVNPKECFKYLKGVSASKLYEHAEVNPIISPSFTDKRFVKARDVVISQCTNLAEMDWEEFEHLVRQLFEWEFSDKGAEVNVTQSSRDGGVDAIVFDADPIRGGKIIIQAKRYTNTVPVSAVRDLYGTIINEGANKGILITTSDYGPDSYKFAQGKPITLLNGGQLLFLMKRHGHHARINIQEAKNKSLKDI